MNNLTLTTSTTLTSLITSAIKPTSSPSTFGFNDNFTYSEASQPSNAVILYWILGVCIFLIILLLSVSSVILYIRCYAILKQTRSANRRMAAARFSDGSVNNGYDPDQPANKPPIYEHYLECAETDKLPTYGSFRNKIKCEATTSSNAHNQTIATIDETILNPPNISVLVQEEIDMAIVSNNNDNYNNNDNNNNSSSSSSSNSNGNIDNNNNNKTFTTQNATVASNTNLSNRVDSSSDERV